MRGLDRNYRFYANSNGLIARPGWFKDVAPESFPLAHTAMAGTRKAGFNTENHGEPRRTTEKARRSKIHGASETTRGAKRHQFFSVPSPCFSVVLRVKILPFWRCIELPLPIQGKP